jgi:hypothetical protein
MASAEDGYGFIPTEYVSLHGTGSTLIKLTAHGWKVCQWRTGGYATIAEGCKSYEDALAAYVAWMHRPADNDVDW